MFICIRHIINYIILHYNDAIKKVIVKNIVKGIENYFNNKKIIV